MLYLFCSCTTKRLEDLGFICVISRVKVSLRVSFALSSWVKAHTATPRSSTKDVWSDSGVGSTCLLLLLWRRCFSCRLNVSCVVVISSIMLLLLKRSCNRDRLMTPFCVVFIFDDWAEIVWCNQWIYLRTRNENKIGLFLSCGWSLWLQTWWYPRFAKEWDF